MREEKNEGKETEADANGGKIKNAAGEDVDFDSIEPTSTYWYIYLANPEDEYGYCLALNARNYSQDDLIAFAKTLTINNSH